MNKKMKDGVDNAIYCDGNIIGPTWKKCYILPYESRWSIREKYCSLNAYSYRKYAKIEDDILAQNRKNSEGIPALDKAIQFDKSLVVSHVRICKKCIVKGYHSKLHQISLMDYCFIHDEERLVEIDIPYRGGRQPFCYDGIEKVYNKHIVEIIDNTAFRTEIQKAVNKLNEIAVLFYFDYCNSHRNRQFGLNSPYGSTKLAYKYIVEEKTNIDANEFTCIFDYDETGLRKTISTTGKTNAELDLYIWKSQEKCVGEDTTRINVLENEILNDFRKLFNKSPEQYHQILWNCRNTYIYSMITYMLSYRTEMKQVETKGINSRPLPQFLCCVKNHRYSLYGCGFNEEYQ